MGADAERSVSGFRETVNPSVGFDFICRSVSYQVGPSFLNSVDIRVQVVELQTVRHVFVCSSSAADKQLNKPYQINRVFRTSLHIRIDLT